MKIFIKPNLDKPGAAKCALRAASTLNKIADNLGKPVEIFFDENDKNYMNRLENVVFGPFCEMLCACDIVVSIGGDGTIMRAARLAACEDKPILGINAGHVGFLTQAEIDELDELERLFMGQYTILNRMMLEAKIENIERQTETFTALNDVVIRHGDADRIVEIEVRQGEKLVASHRADGIIFSTPTGSTAYSMSAGGPIVSPEMELILMTAICPHSAFNCSLILSPESDYTVHEKIYSNQNGMYVSLDGVRVGRLCPGGTVTVSRSKTAAKFIDLGLREFFSNLNQKLSWRR